MQSKLLRQHSLKVLAGVAQAPVLQAGWCASSVSGHWPSSSFRSQNQIPSLESINESNGRSLWPIVLTWASLPNIHLQLVEFWYIITSGEPGYVHQAQQLGSWSWPASSQHTAPLKSGMKDTPGHHGQCKPTVPRCSEMGSSCLEWDCDEARWELEL